MKGIKKIKLDIN